MKAFSTFGSPSLDALFTGTQPRQRQSLGCVSSQGEKRKKGEEEGNNSFMISVSVLAPSYSASLASCAPFPPLARTWAFLQLEPPRQLRAAIVRGLADRRLEVLCGAYESRRRTPPPCLFNDPLLRA